MQQSDHWHPALPIAKDVALLLVATPAPNPHPVPRNLTNHAGDWNDPPAEEKPSTLFTTLRKNQKETAAAWLS
jgi:hypothetical protein